MRGTFLSDSWAYSWTPGARRRDRLFELFMKMPKRCFSSGLLRNPGARCGESPFALFRPENAEKVIPTHGLLSGACRKGDSPLLGSSLDAWSPVQGNHLFELFKAENAEKGFPHIWAPFWITFLSFSGLKMPKR